MIWEISVACIAAAFAVIAVFLARALRTAERSMRQAAETLNVMHNTVADLSSDVKQLVHQANDLAADAQRQLKLLEPVLEAVHLTGEALGETALTAKQVSAALAGILRSRSKTAKASAAASNAKAPEPEPRKGANGPASSPANGQSNGQTNSQTNGQTTAQADPAMAEKGTDAGSEAGWVKWADIAAEMWQKYRS
ncbi:DUF948 domain-containing protein [Paenibacillus macerans]|uniref:DUF948 domain-containing protein n=1 Tax=Paenibacillus macerans TaxID=44252 RepID=UPI00204095AC|nr:DUF948 domain-containing protein [Paenibacillus macerans]MCM3702893.1 DUF948 domain-containing protein [Paenibacillus macerans]